MKKIIYTRPDGGLSVIIPMSRLRIQAALNRELTEAEYEEHVRSRSIPSDAINVRSVDDSDIPTSREFRGAWCDTESGTQVDINCQTAKDLCLEQLRTERNAKLGTTDKDINRFLEAQDTSSQDFLDLKTYRQALRDSTEPLKAIDATGKINDTSILDDIRSNSTLKI